MNKLTRTFASLGLIAALGGSALTLAAVEDQIRERIEPAGNVNIAGQEGQQMQQQSSGPRGGEEVYTAACSACHDSGAAGAPKFGDSGAWGIASVRARKRSTSTRSMVSMPCRPRVVVATVRMKKSRTPSITWLRRANNPVELPPKGIRVPGVVV